MSILMFQVPARDYEAIPGLGANDRQRTSCHASSIREFNLLTYYGQNNKHY